ncbi:MAG: nucleotidyl transferase AbiEii/AbiGii toxin family protein [Nitrospiria bacterium]
MTGKKFMNAVANGAIDILGMVLTILEEVGSPYCVIGGLSVNAYVEPVVSLDLDIVITTKYLEEVCKAGKAKGLKVEHFEHSVNLTASRSDLRVQLQTDPRYQSFIQRAVKKEVLGYRMNVASLEDVLQGKVWAYSDGRRRKSKRQKDLADIMRLVEAYPSLENQLPKNIKEALK